jgi:hypothetical protein
MNLYIVILMSLGTVKPNDVEYDYVDLIEINHFIDSQGRLVFDQIIFYEWSRDETRFHVRAWRLIKSQSQIPRRVVRGGFSAIWHDGDVLRDISTPAVAETWTQYDPEIMERAFLPQDKRNGLRKWAQKKSPPQ